MSHYRAHLPVSYCSATHNTRSVLTSSAISKPPPNYSSLVVRPEKYDGMPTAKPRTAAMIGLWKLSRASFRFFSHPRWKAWAVEMWASLVRSAPAAGRYQRARFDLPDDIPEKGPCPLPVSTTARTVSSLSDWDSTSINSLVRSCDNALRFSGRFSFTMATLPSLRDTMRPDVIMSVPLGPGSVGCFECFTS